MKDLISVITTFYNSEKYILQCIKSVNEQIVDNTFDIEYILINDCSEDKSELIINKYFNESKNINYKIIKNEKNFGSGISKKLGIQNANGDYFMFLDSDDYYLNNDFILRAHKLIVNYKADIIEFGYQRYLINENRKIYKVVDSIIEVKNDPIIKFDYLCTSHIINYMIWTKIIKRSIVESKSYDEMNSYDDVKTTPYWIYNANKIIIYPSVEINYRNRKNSIINNNDVQKCVDLISAVSSLFEFFKSNKDILKILYKSIINELKYILLNFNSDFEEFNHISKLNEYMLSYIFEKDNIK